MFMFCISQKLKQVETNFCLSVCMYSYIWLPVCMYLCMSERMSVYASGPDAQ